MKGTKDPNVLETSLRMLLLASIWPFETIWLQILSLFGWGRKSWNHSFAVMVEEHLTLQQKNVAFSICFTYCTSTLLFHHFNSGFVLFCCTCITIWFRYCRGEISVVDVRSDSSWYTIKGVSQKHAEVCHHCRCCVVEGRSAGLSWVRSCLKSPPLGERSQMLKCLWRYNTEFHVPVWFYQSVVWDRIES